MVAPSLFTKSVAGRIICIRQKDGSEYWLSNPDPGTDPVLDAAHTKRQNQSVQCIQCFSGCDLIFNKTERNSELLPLSVGIII